jgi:hypothetical protein
MSTAAGGGILSWLDDAITIRSGAAKRACDGGEGRWHNGWIPEWMPEVDINEQDEGSGEGVSDERDRTIVYDEGGRPSKDQSVHIALHDPASVLRRCAADRKILELHQPVPDHGRYSEPECPADCDGQHSGPTVCMACRSYAGDPLDAPCLTVRLLAEGYGWTEAQR